MDWDQYSLPVPDAVLNSSMQNRISLTQSPLRSTRPVNACKTGEDTSTTNKVLDLNGNQNSTIKSTAAANSSNSNLLQRTEASSHAPQASAAPTLDGTFTTITADDLRSGIEIPCVSYNPKSVPGQIRGAQREDISADAVGTYSPALSNYSGNRTLLLQGLHCVSNRKMKDVDAGESREVASLATRQPERRIDKLNIDQWTPAATEEHISNSDLSRNPAGSHSSRPEILGPSFGAVNDTLSERSENINDPHGYYKQAEERIAKRKAAEALDEHNTSERPRMRQGQGPPLPFGSSHYDLRHPAASTYYSDPYDSMKSARNTYHVPPHLRSPRSAWAPSHFPLTSHENVRNTSILPATFDGLPYSHTKHDPYGSMATPPSRAIPDPRPRAASDFYENNTTSSIITTNSAAHLVESVAAQAPAHSKSEPKPGEFFHRQFRNFQAPDESVLSRQLSHRGRYPSPFPHPLRKTQDIPQFKNGGSVDITSADGDSLDDDQSFTGQVEDTPVIRHAPQIPGFDYDNLLNHSGSSTSGYNWRNTGEGLQPSRHSDDTGPWPCNTVPKSIPRQFVSDAALLKRGLPLTNRKRVINRSYGVNDPENIAIVNMKDREGLSWSEIGEKLNAQRVAAGKTELLTNTAIANRYNRNCPILMAAAGLDFVPLAKRKRTNNGEPEPPRIDWNEENDVTLVETVKDFDAERWEAVALEFTERSGIPVHPMEACRRYSAIK